LALVVQVLHKILQQEVVVVLTLYLVQLHLLVAVAVVVLLVQALVQD
jgi:hypothetical protein